ncbi:hypothetical protein EV356DRAFT_501698 [Viridothelium virens]|uniref:Uncharacterized protein n=1 Tax=Viridothelium virens TaxID=1048519 RepID=A0A6A6H8Q9_VIRVR|nr:hypothetical protein EV356DRAFT_501698 [Viridothelium virens]
MTSLTALVSTTAASEARYDLLIISDVIENALQIHSTPDSVVIASLCHAWQLGCQIPHRLPKASRVVCFLFVLDFLDSSLRRPAYCVRVLSMARHGYKICIPTRLQRHCDT